MNRSDLRPEGRALTVGVTLLVAVAGFGLAVLALRHSASPRTLEAHSGPTNAKAVRANGLIAFGCGYHVCTVMPDGSAFTDLIEPYDKEVVLAAYSPVFSPDGSKIVFRGYPRSGLEASGGATTTST